MAAESVFISSTSSDLRAHRAAVNEALRKSGYHVIDMADFGARAEGATSACLDEVGDCEIFVGIYAWRYGFVPPGSDISITEQEYNEARRLNKPCYCFIVDEAHEWPEELKEGGVGSARLVILKARIEAELVRATFTTPDNLALQVVTSLNRRERGQAKLLAEAANSKIPGAYSADEAINMIGTVLETAEVPFEFEHGAFFIPFGTTFLIAEVENDDRLGLMVDFRAVLADEFDIREIPADVASQLLSLSWTMPVGGVALDEGAGTMWYRCRVPAAMLNEEQIFSFISHVAATADSLDEPVRAALPTLPPPKKGWRR